MIHPFRPEQLKEAGSEKTRLFAFYSQLALVLVSINIEGRTQMNRKEKVTTCVSTAVFFLSLSLLHSTVAQAFTAVRALDQSALDSIRGGACNNVGCVPQTCNISTCNAISVCTVVTGTTNCIKVTTTNGQLCDAKPNRTLCNDSIFAQNCGTLWTGVEDDQSCCSTSDPPTDQCKSSGNKCGGPVRTCGDTACPPG